MTPEEKFQLMKCMFPSEVIQQKMRIEGYTETQITTFLNDSYLPSLSSTTAELLSSTMKQQKLPVYDKMRTMLPEEAVKQKMSADGFTPLEIDCYFHVSTVPLTFLTDKNRETYEKMKRILPAEAVRQRMTVDGIGLCQIDAFMKEKEGDMTQDEMEMGKYERMKKFIPHEAVKQRMLADGIPQDRVELLF